MSNITTNHAITYTNQKRVSGNQPYVSYFIARKFLTLITTKIRQSRLRGRRSKGRASKEKGVGKVVKSNSKKAK